MSRTLASPLHKALIDFLIEERKMAGLTQAQVAKNMGRYQSYVATVESGQRRIDIVDLFTFADAIGFDPVKAIKRLKTL